jgi:hypothetical protein
MLMLALPQELEDYNACSASFQRALDTLPTPAPAQQKRQFEMELKAVQTLIAERAKRAALLRQPLEGLPWEVAARMRPQLVRAGAAGRNSSAWAVIASHSVLLLPEVLSLRCLMSVQAFTAGVKAIMSTKPEPSSPGAFYDVPAPVCVCAWTPLTDRS